MRMLLCSALGLLMLAGCVCSKPQTSIEPAAVDSIPVVPFVTEQGVSTALLSEDSTLVTVSHAIPRRKTSGVAEVSSVWCNYSVTASGDKLEHSWGAWSSATAPSGQGKDWAVLSLSPPLVPSSVFPSPVTITWSDQPPKVGEQLVLVGYTREGEQLVRYWTWVEVIDVPAQHQERNAENHVWFKTVSGKGLRQGFSGAPLLRQCNDGRFEACAMMVAAQCVKGGNFLDVGVAIVLNNSSRGGK